MDFSSIGLLPSPAISNSAVDSHGNRTCQVTWLLQCTWILVRTICQTCCTVMCCGCIYSKSFEYSPGTCVPFDLTVCMLDIFCCGPSILHMSFSSLQASSLLSSRQPGTVCRNLQTCSEMLVNLILPGFGNGN